MRAKITTSLGYSLLTVAAVAGFASANTQLNFLQFAQLAVLGAGAVALLLVTRTRSTK